MEVGVVTVYVSKELRDNFKERLESALNLISQYQIEYEEIGIFGSYARDEFKNTSDIDICIITTKHPDRRVSGSLREEAEILGVDIVYVTPEYFKNCDSRFAKNLRNDYRRL